VRLPCALAPSLIRVDGILHSPQGFDVVNRKAREAQILRRAREIATAGREISRHSIEAKLRFEMDEPLALEILNDQQFKAELDRVCIEARMLRAKKREATRADAGAISRTPEIPRPKRRRLNAEQKRALKAGALQVFVRQYARKAQKNTEPNDRCYDRNIGKAIKRMKPEVLDRLLRSDDEQD